ncbi:hypothetical protein LCGC14_1351720 [marine sediment metagenome]|uniref:Uncharacterized protein n=1 Tax=marine sediment metagenome TaxID=412755 RepID=A0A0F9KBI4_9ZZZZ
MKFKEWFEVWMISIKCVFFRWTGLYKCPHCDKVINTEDLYRREEIN